MHTQAKAAKTSPFLAIPLNVMRLQDEGIKACCGMEMELNILIADNLSIHYY
jgi:hypothetical protein